MIDTPLSDQSALISAAAVAFALASLVGVAFLAALARTRALSIPQPPVIVRTVRVPANDNVAPARHLGRGMRDRIRLVGGFAGPR